MPLHKPKIIPKIPKARKKKAHTAFKAIPSKKPDKLELTCKVFYKYDEAVKKQFTVFLIETVAEFTSFSYEISVESIREKFVINFIIIGLKANINSIPQIMPASKEIFFEELIGDYTINILKQDGAINSAEFHFNIFKKEILLLNQFQPKKKNNRLFCEFKVAEEEFSFSD